MRILFYTPFKPLDHPNPSGDLVIATGLYNFLKRQGHQVWPISRLRTRWIFWKPWLFPLIIKEQRKAIRKIIKYKPDLWMTYHTYYKAPDILGAAVCKRQQLPYVIFQGIYSTKRKRNLKTLPGFLLNREALNDAAHIFTNRCEDLKNLKRLINERQLSYVAPGIYPEEFSFDSQARIKLRKSWQVGDDPVVLSVAMFRPGVKAQGLMWTIKACGKLVQQGQKFHLVIAGDGSEKGRLRQIAGKELPGRVTFVGKIPRSGLYAFYSAGDVFAFPGFRESLGMVFLEAQSCGLPVVAFENGGIPEVVKNEKTGLLVQLNSIDLYAQAILRLLSDKTKRREMGETAKKSVRKDHDLSCNYKVMEKILASVIRK